MLALVKDGVVHFIPLQAVHFKLIRTVQIILIYPVHLKVIWAVHLNRCNHIYVIFTISKQKSTIYEKDIEIENQIETIEGQLKTIEEKM